MSEIKTVVVDEGSAQIKVIWIDDKTKKIESLVIPSMVGDEAGTDAVGNVLDSSYTIGKNEYFVSPNLREPITTKNEKYQVSEENRVLVHEALRKAGFGGKKLNIMSTLPVSQFFQGDGRRANSEWIDEKKRNLMNSVQNINGLPLAQIESCSVAPESIPAWFDVAIDETGFWDEKLADSQLVMVVDIGGRTTDLSIVDGLGAPERKHSINLGVFDIANELTRIMIEEKKAKSLPRAHIDAVLRTGSYREINCIDMIKLASERVMKRILRKMSEYEHDSMVFNHILYVGGGAALIGEDLAIEYGNKGRSHIPDNPDLSVARGLMKIELANALVDE